ncbi:hypothetical protein BC936DRAFT_146113 [Jimgerdemannia flammicorona]|uniref:ATP-dependent DNA helicase n=1 Tax=Jimgerdemannia flammicorona TaxID=994334 RepID=A0A433D8B7_9FUNG|nr:hypothetical protein BC936DRAFT_146113 [Jimgerdemannia flammicorona]
MVVMLTRNVATARGLVNGALRKVVRFDRTQYTAGVVQTKANDMSAPVVVVHFQNGLVEGIHCCEWTVDMGNGHYATRWQLPLLPAWAMTIHKAQGRIYII